MAKVIFLLALWTLNLSGFLFLVDSKKIKLIKRRTFLLISGAALITVLILTYSSPKQFTIPFRGSIVLFLVLIIQYFLTKWASTQSDNKSIDNMNQNVFNSVLVPFIAIGMSIGQFMLLFVIANK